MKTLTILTAILLLFVLTTRAQDTIQQWNIGIYDSNIGPEHPLPYWHSEIYKTSVDTIIGSINYKKLYISNDSLFVDSTYFGGLRSDTNKMVLYKNMEEQILFDFNLNIGDTMFNISCENAVVDSIDIVFLNGRNLKKLFVSYYSIGQNDIWIEDVGSINFGLFVNLCITGSQEKHFLCYKEDNELLIQNPDYNTCFKESIASNLLVISNDLYKLFPNPSSGNVQLIMSNEQLGSRIEIVSITGKTVHTSSLRGTKQSVSLDLSNQAKGIYFVKLIGEGFVSTQKLVLD